MGADQVFSQDYRKQVIEEIEGDENVKRKKESLRRYEIYNDRLEEYVYDVLSRDLAQATLEDMRVISSINLCKRIVDEQSSIYGRTPTRKLTDSDEKSDELFSNIYDLGRVNTALKKANTCYKLQDQCALQVIPKAGKLKVKVLQPHHYDIVASDDDPETPEIFILSQYNKDKLFDQVRNSNNYTPKSSAAEHRGSDGRNQDIADQSDWESKRGRYVWWTGANHFMTDKDGHIINKSTSEPYVGEIPVDEIVNPLGQLPFVDVKNDNDGEYWARCGNATVDFTIDMAVILSDVAEVNRLQGFAQPIISAVEPPTDMKIGPNSVLFLKKSKNAEPGAQPQFEFASPSPDLQGSIEMVRTFLSMYLTSKGLDPAVVTADGTSARYASGIDRLLANLEKFEASADDFSLFKSVEKELFKLFKSWLEVYSGVSVGGLDADISGIIPAEIKLEVQFDRPSGQVSETDKMDVIERKMDMGMLTKVEAIMELREVDEDAARNILEDIEAEKPDVMGGFNIGDREPEIFGDES